MDFGQLLHTAQKNDKTKKEIRYYSTKYDPPKKEQRSKELSANIQRFLAKQKEEEERKNYELQRKKDELLALRAQDKKATRRVNVMLKRTKSANQSVIQDAVDRDNTAVTLAGPSQPDEDDYGYVSQEASAFYNKMMEKYSKMPDEPKFDFTKKKVNSNLKSTKDRVKAALDKEQQDALLPHKRKRKVKTDEGDDEDVAREKDSYGRDSENKTTPKPRPKVAAPPPMNFADLLKIAEKKQFEPIIIEQKPKEEEKLFTKKQKKEMERDREIKEKRDARHALENAKQSSGGRIPKINDDKSRPNQPNDRPSTSSIEKTKSNMSSKPTNSPNRIPSNGLSKPKPNSSTMKAPILNNRLVNGSNSSPNLVRSTTSGYTSSVNKSNPSHSNQKAIPQKSDPQRRPKDFPPKDLKMRKPEDNRPRKADNGPPKQFPPKDIRPKQFPPADLRPKQFPPGDLRPKQFPPGDVRGGRPPIKKPKLTARKRQIIDDDSEYDSEMDDFIDDGPEGQEDYSKYISEIFGYDKRKYRDVDEEVDNMESTFAQQMREEVISTKIGIMEDLEDMKMEELHKKRKAQIKRKL